MKLMIALIILSIAIALVAMLEKPAYSCDDGNGSGTYLNPGITEHYNAEGDLTGTSVNCIYDCY